MLLNRASVRYLYRHPLQFGLAVLGVAVGVAMVVSIDLANESARRAFISSAQTLSGTATHQIVGGSTGLPEGLYRKLRVDLGISQTTPFVEGYVDVPAVKRTFQLIGIDPFSEVSFGRYMPGADTNGDMGRLLTEPGTVLMTAGNADAMGITTGDTFSMVFGGRQHSLTLVGLIEARDGFNQQALATILFTDIATAQELVGTTGRLTRINLVISHGAQGEALLAHIRAQLPAGAAIIGADTRSRTLQQMTHAFQTNLTGLSLLALVVGLFLIYNTMTFSVIQRRVYIGTLRTLGVVRKEIFTMVVREVLIIACLGTLTGLVLGVVLAHGLLHLVTRTINDLYFPLDVSEVTISGWSILKAIILGLGVTLITALMPAIAATRTLPTTVMQRSMFESRRRRRIMLPMVLAGVAIMALGAALLWMPMDTLVLSYGGMFLLIIGFVCITPLAVVALLRLMQIPLGAVTGLLGRLATRELIASLSRTTVAVGALAVAVAVTIGVGIMIVSFRDAVQGWLEQYLRADIYITVPGANHTVNTPVIDPSLIKRLSGLNGVSSIATGRRIDITSLAGITELHVIDMSRDAFRAYRFKQGNGDMIWPRLHNDSVIISEPYAFHNHLKAGDSVTLRTDHGRHAFPIAGVFYDYGSDQGVVTIQRGVYERYWNDRHITSLGISLVTGAKPQTVINAINDAVSNRQAIMVRSNRDLRIASLEIFDRTFAITTVLRMLAIVVAFIGILSALMALQLEKVYTYAVLRANGLTPRQVWGMTSIQTGLMGFSAGVLAIPLGIILAVVLVYVINQRSFGWSMQILLEPAMLLQAVILAVIAALIAGIYPAYRLSHMMPQRVLSEE